MCGRDWAANCRLVAAAEAAEETATSADNSTTRPQKNTIIRIMFGIRKAPYGAPDLVNARAFGYLRQPFGNRPGLLYDTEMISTFEHVLPSHKLPAPTLAEFEAIAESAFARLPAHFRALCQDLVVCVDDFPSDEVVKAMHLASEYDLLGLFQGVGLPFQSATVPQVLPNMIWLYRRPILAYWAEHKNPLGAVVTHVLVHEIGHHFGLSDEDMAAIEEAAD